jgi:hypothetical protein
LGSCQFFLSDKVSHDFPSFGTLPHEAWCALGLLELVCTAGCILPDALDSHPQLIVLAAVLAAFESLLFIAVHPLRTENSE